MTSCLMSRTYVDISKWWPVKEGGKPASVYSIYTKIEGTANEVSRHTLTRARDGLLEKADISNLTALARLCSLWAGETIKVDDLIKEENDG